MSTKGKSPRIPPRWIVLIAWRVHRAIYKVTRGRSGLWPAEPEKWGAMRVTTVGRRTGKERSVILGYFEDGPNLVTMAMNGWGEGRTGLVGLNLLANPEATIVLTDGTRAVRAAAAKGAERDRLWARLQELDEGLDGYAAMRSTETAVVVFSPRA